MESCNLYASVRTVNLACDGTGLGRKYLDLAIIQNGMIVASPQRFSLILRLENTD